MQIMFALHKSEVYDEKPRRCATIAGAMYTITDKYFNMGIIGIIPDVYILCLNMELVLVGSKKATIRLPYFERKTRFELATFGLGSRRSTN